VIEGHDPEIEKKQLSRARTVKNPEIKNWCRNLRIYKVVRAKIET
jgi:hypothetical protein